MNFLERILDYKRTEVLELLKISDDFSHPINEIRREGGASSGLFRTALQRSGLSVIAEIKRRSPSRGSLAKIHNPSALAFAYCEGGASAISVLTDANHFGGSLEDLRSVSYELKSCFPHVPILRKDFILHPLQIAEAAFFGANAVLLLAGVLGPQLKNFLAEAERMGLESLTEVHHEEELKLALDCGATIIGINHRNLETFEMDMSLSHRLRPLIPSDCLAVAESGIHSVEQAHQLEALEFHAVLIGESLVKAQDPSQFISQIHRGNK